MASPAWDFRDQLVRLASKAEQAADDITERVFDLGGVRVGLRFIGRDVEGHVAPAIEQAELPAGTQPDYMITCWDCEELAQPYPVAPVGKDGFTPRGEITPLCADGISTAFDTGGRMLSLLDTGAKRGWFVVGRSADIPRFDRAEPMRGMLSWVLRAHGRQFVHAGAVGHEDGGVLLLGRSGMGKSNSCLSTLQASLKYASDDFCAISTDPVPTAHSIYSTGKTRHSDWDRHAFLADLAPDIDPTGEEKVIYFLHRAVPQKLIAQFPVRALLVVRQGFDETRIVPAAPELALMETAPETTRLLPDAGGEVMQQINRLVRAVPTYMLQIGKEPADIVSRIEELLEGFRAKRPLS